MATELFDNATSPGTSTTLSEAATATATTISVSGPASTALQTAGGQSRWVMFDPSTGNIELVLLTGGAWSSQWEVERGIEGTIAQAFTTGSIVRHILTAGAIYNILGITSPTISDDIPVWAADTDYPTDFVVQEGNALWSRNSPGGVSASTWAVDQTNWTEISAAGGGGGGGGGGITMANSYAMASLIG